MTAAKKPAKPGPKKKDKAPAGKGKPNLGGMRTKANSRLPLKQVGKSFKPLVVLATESVRKLSPIDGEILEAHTKEILDAIQHAADNSPRFHLALAQAKSAGAWTPAMIVALKIAGAMWTARQRPRPQQTEDAGEDAPSGQPGSQGFPGATDQPPNTSGELPPDWLATVTPGGQQ